METIGHFRTTFGLSSKWVLVPILSYEKEISVTCKLNYFSYEWLWTNKEALIRQIGNGRLCSNKELRHKIENSKYDNWRMYYSAHPRELVLSFLNYHVHNTWKWVVVCQSAQWSYIPEDDTRTRKTLKKLLREINRYSISPQDIKHTDKQTSGDNNKGCN